VRALMFGQCSVVAAVRDVLWRARRVCLYAALVCAMRRAWLVAVRCLGDTRHDSDVPSCWVGLVASCLSARARVCLA
jgi:hypothetical protein